MSGKSKPSVAPGMSHMASGWKPTGTPSSAAAFQKGSAARLGDGGLDVDHGDGADADQALRGRGAVVPQPVVVGAAEAAGDPGRRVADRETDRRVEDGDVDALRVHVLQARGAVEGAGRCVVVADLPGEHVVGAPADRAREAHEPANRPRDRVRPRRLRAVLGGEDAPADDLVGDEDQLGELRVEVALPHAARSRTWPSAAITVSFASPAIVE